MQHQTSSLLGLAGFSGMGVNGLPELAGLVRRRAAVATDAQSSMGCWKAQLCFPPRDEGLY